MNLKYIVCSKCGQVNPCLMFRRVMLKMQAHKIKDKEKRMQTIRKLKSLSWEEFAKLLEMVEE